VSHGFLRFADGAITTFDVPFGNVYGTSPASISLTGAVTGSYADANGVGHGFLRAAGGVTVTFDAQGATNGTYPAAISPTGEVVGYFIDANNVFHGFFRRPNGNLSTFDAPGASGTTLPLGIAALGTIAGVDGPFPSLGGFLRNINGAFTSFNPPGPIGAGDFYGDMTFLVNPEGVIAGSYFQTIAGNPFGGNYQIFIRALDGTITTFATGNNTPCCSWSCPTGINLENVIVGLNNDGYNVNHGFLRAPNGSITTFDAPGAGVGFNQGTIPLGITSLGEIMGRFRDSGGVSHGFTLTPQWPALSAAR